MADAGHDKTRVSTGPVLATTYEGDDPALLEAILPHVGYIEVTPDTIARRTDSGSVLRSSVVAELNGIAGSMPLLVHGVGLSIGTCDGYSREYLGLLDQCFERFHVAWHSEHLAYTMVEGESLGTMLALPRTDESLDMVSERVLSIQRRYCAPFLLEHVVHLLPDAPGTYTDAGFLNLLAERTGCGFILDAYNLECDARNYGFDIATFLDELNLANVREIHLAGGTALGGFQLDVHARITGQSTVALARDVLGRAPGVRAVTYEYLKEAVPALGHAGIENELVRLAEELEL